MLGTRAAEPNQEKLLISSFLKATTNPKMKLAVSVLALASSAAAFQAPTMTFSLGGKGKKAAPKPAVSFLRPIQCGYMMVQYANGSM